MFQRCLARRWFHSTVSLGCLLTGLWFAASPSTAADMDSVVSDMNHRSSTPAVEPLLSGDETTPSNLSGDPFDSPYPVPWTWVIETQREYSQKQMRGRRYYRSESLISPDGKYAAYARIQMIAEPELYYSQVNSVIFLENLETGELQVIQATSPIAEHLQQVKETPELPGAMSILIPVSWSADGDLLLSRQLEGFFNTSDASDYGVIWERQTNQTKTVTPTQGDDSEAILLGWNDVNSEQVLFRTGILGDEDWPVVSVDFNGKTLLANQPEPVTYGHLITRNWTGSQILH